MRAGVAGAVVVAAAPSGLCSAEVFPAAPVRDPALAPSLSVDVDEGPFTLATMSKISKTEEKKSLTDFYRQSISEVVNHKSKTHKNWYFKAHTARFYSLHKN